MNNVADVQFQPACLFALLSRCLGYILLSLNLIV